MKKAVVINDLSGFGKCSLTAAIPVLSVMGVQCVPLATAVLTGQTGYEHFFCTDLTDMMPEYLRVWQQNEVHFDAIYSGFLTGARQTSYVSQLIDNFRTPDTFVLIDPVMGDNGHTYKLFTEELLTGMKELTRKADMITPNLTEACLLAGIDPACMEEKQQKGELIHLAKVAARTIQEQLDHPQEILITGIKSFDGGEPYIYNLALCGDTIFVTRSIFHERSYSGTGDLFASCMCGMRLNGIPTSTALEQTQAFLNCGIEDAIKEDIFGQEGIHFEKHLSMLLPQV